MQDVQEALSVVEHFAASLPPSLWAVGVGFRERGGVLGKDLCIVFFAHQKRAATDVAASELVPPMLNGMPTDVRDARRVHHAQPSTARFDPLVGGIQMTVTGKANFDGTLSGVFRDRTSGNLMAITNNHVVGFRVGIVAFFHGQHGVIDGFQPSEVPADDFGVTVKRSVEPDCAAIRLNASRTAPTATLLRDARGEGELRVVRIAEPSLGDAVFKIGARTDYTEGSVTVIGPQVIEVRPRNAPDELITDHGDSGSLWCRRDGNDVVAVALHHSGNTTPPSVAYAAPMTVVARTLNIDVL